MKPLFYAVTPDPSCFFGSEIKALLTSSVNNAVAPNWQAVSDFLTYLYVPGPGAAFDGVWQQLPPAHSLTMHLKNNSISL